MNKIQDIHLTDAGLLGQVQEYWRNGNYAAILALLENYPQLDTKAIVAQIINDIQDWLYDLQQYNDPTFKADKIQVSSTAPILGNGEVWFQLD